MKNTPETIFIACKKYRNGWVVRFDFKEHPSTEFIAKDLVKFLASIQAKYQKKHGKKVKKS